MLILSSLTVQPYTYPMDATLQFIPIMIFGFAASLGLTPITRQIAMRLGVTAAPNKRNIHASHMPLMGGAAIYVAFVLSIVLFSPARYQIELGAIVIGATLLAWIGYLDDRKDLNAQVRLVVMTAAALVVTLAGVQIRLFGIPLIDIPLTLFWIVAIINAVNWIDNMDGLAAGTSAITSGFFLFLAVTQGQILVSMLAAAIFGSAVGFLTYNFNPSSTFMGDMGAYTLGFVLAILAIKLKFESQPLNVTWMVPIFVLAVPVIDINLAILTRLAEGRSPMQAGKDHISHRIMSMGFSQRQTLFILYILSVLFGGIAVIVSQVEPQRAFTIGTFSLGVMIALFLLLVYIRQRYQKSQEASEA